MPASTRAACTARSTSSRALAATVAATSGDSRRAVRRNGSCRPRPGRSSARVAARRPIADRAPTRCAKGAPGCARSCPASGPHLGDKLAERRGQPHQRVAEEVALEASAPGQQQGGTRARPAPGHRPGGGTVHPLHVPAVHLHHGHPERPQPPAQTPTGQRFASGADRPPVVLAHEHDRQTPRGGHVERLHEHPLVDRTVAEEGHRDRAPLGVTGGQAEAAGEGAGSSDDPRGRGEVGLGHQVHVASPPAAETTLCSQHLQQERGQVNPRATKAGVER